jgi:hypothetical protein
VATRAMSLELNGIYANQELAHCCNSDFAGDQSSRWIDPGIPFAIPPQNDSRAVIGSDFSPATRYSAQDRSSAV